MQERGQKRPVRWCEGNCGRPEVALEYGELMAQGEDLDVLVTVTHRQQEQDGEGVGDGQIGQTKQHPHIMPVSNAQPCRLADSLVTAPANARTITCRLNSTDLIFGMHNTGAIRSVA
jgi:hypothetical protein